MRVNYFLAFAVFAQNQSSNLLPQVIQQVRCLTLVTFWRIIKLAQFLESSFHLWNPLAHDGVPVIFYTVISSSLQEFCQFRPLAAQYNMCQKQNPLLLICPLISSNGGAQVIEPSLTALLTRPIRNILSYMRPFCCTQSIHHTNQQFILLLTP